MRKDNTFLRKRQRNDQNQDLPISVWGLRMNGTAFLTKIGKYLPTTPIPPKISEIDPTYLPTTPKV